MTQLREPTVIASLVAALLGLVVSPATSAQVQDGESQTAKQAVAPAHPAAPAQAAASAVLSDTQPGSAPAQVQATSPNGQTSPSSPSGEATPRPAPVPAEAGSPAKPAEAMATQESEPAPVIDTEVAPPVDSVVETPNLRIDLWERLRKAYALPVLDNDLVRKWEQYYTTRPEYLNRMFERGGRYLFHIVEEVGRRQMPAELALLPFVESAFNPHAVSSARASGIWQFMPATGRSFDLRQNVFRDDRRSVLDSTRAALDYLTQLNGLFGDWQLALAAYNWGQGNVGRALASNRRLGRGVRYEELPMPEETRNYVPKLQAIANIVSRPEQFGIQLPPLENHPYFLTVRVDRDIDVALAARLAQLPLEEFQALNPQMNKPVILAAGTPMLLLPFDNAQRFQTELNNHRGPFASWTAWVAPATLNPAEVARRVGMSENQLREVNRIPPRMLVRAGSTLLVPRAQGVMSDVSEHVADTAAIILAPESQPGRRLVVKVGPKGESVAGLAQRYRVSAVQLASWNSVSAKDRFKPGQQVVVFSKAPAPVTAKARSGGERVAAKGPGSAQARKAAGPRPAVRVASRPSNPRR